MYGVISVHSTFSSSTCSEIESLCCNTDLWACKGAEEDSHLFHTSSLGKYPWSPCELWSLGWPASDL